MANWEKLISVELQAVWQLPQKFPQSALPPSEYLNAL